MQIVDVNPVFDGFEADLVGGAVLHARLHTAARHPIGKSVRIMVAARAAFLHDRQTAEFAAPNHQRVL